MSVLHDAQDAHEPSHDAREQDAREQVEDSSMERAAAPTPMTEPLSALDTRRANAEAIKRAPETSEAVSEARRRGRIEAETRRISEEMTQQAQEQRRTEGARAQQQARMQVTDATQVAGAALAPLRPVPGGCQFKRVLAPLDGSFYAERALPYATALARLTGADLLFGYVRLPSPPAPVEVVRRVAADLLSREREPHPTDVQAYLDALRVLQAFHTPTVRVETIEQSDAAHGLRQLAEQDQSDGIVLATHARQGIERQVLGSTVDALVEHSHLPLLIIPPNVLVQPEPSFGNVLVPLDGSHVAEHALGALMGVIRASASPDVAHQEVTPWQITLFMVIETLALTEEAHAYLDEVEARLKTADLRHGVRIAKQVQLGSAPGAIVATADHGLPAARSAETTAGPFDLVALATHGRGGLGGLLYGSVARYVLPRVGVPVLLVHPADVNR
jgi:nucleotide-binding universal stress UspA family protein